MEINEEIEEERMFIVDQPNGNHFEFRMFIDEDKIHFWLKEDKIFTPFTYEQSFTFDEFVQRHKIFSACDDLKEILCNLKKIYKRNKLILETKEKIKKKEEEDEEDEEEEKEEKDEKNEKEDVVIELLECTGPSERYLKFKVDNISEYKQETDNFILKKKMTENKDKDLKRLYDIQKYQINALKNIKKIFSKEGVSKENPLYKEFMEQIQKFGIII